MSLKTKQNFVDVLKKCGLSAGDSIIVHDCDALRSIKGQGIAVLEAIMSVIGENGTLIVYQLNHDIQDPGYDHDIKFMDRFEVRQYLSTLTEKDLIYNQSPLFQAMMNQSYVYVSHHPRIKVAALGKFAKYITRKGTRDFPFSSESPFQTMLEVNAKILIHQDDFEHCHEIRLAYSDKHEVIVVDGFPKDKQWNTYLDFEDQSQSYRKLLQATKSKQADQFVLFNYADVVAQVNLHQAEKFLAK